MICIFYLSCGSVCVCQLKVCIFPYCVFCSPCENLIIHEHWYFIVRWWMTCSIVQSSQVKSRQAQSSQASPVQLHQSNNLFNNGIVRIRMQNVISMIRSFVSLFFFLFVVLWNSKKKYRLTLNTEQRAFAKMLPLYYMLLAFRSSFAFAFFFFIFPCSLTQAQAHYFIALLLYTHAHSQLRVMRSTHTFMSFWNCDLRTHTSISMQIAKA